MKKNLRLLFLGLVAAAFGTSFAQENVTDKLLNANLEKGVIGWDMTFESNIYKRQKKSQSSYHGFNGYCLENWKSDASTGLTNSTISQTLKNLPNGTYVFGAYLAAAKKDSVANVEQVVGVNLYANEMVVPVATNWPEHTTQKWSHAAKFNVAATVTDGNLTVGIEAKETNANFIIFDNATLYFFGDKDAETALNEMAKIDLANSVALADTCKAHVMNVDTLAVLNAAIEAAQAVEGVEGAYEADEELWWAFRLARTSINDYRNFDKAIAAAEKVAAMEWSPEVADAVAELNELIEAAKAIHAAATADRVALNETKAGLSEASAFIELDSVYTKLTDLEAFCDEVEPGTGVGEYSEDMVYRVEALMELIGEVLGELESSEITAVVAKHKADSLCNLAFDIIANPISYDEFPITIGRRAENLAGYKVLEGATQDSLNYVTYRSKVYRFQEPLSKIRFIVKNTGSDGKCGDFVFFTLSSFEMYDENGDEIFLDEDDLFSNADHNRLNPNALDGQGLAALVDDNPNTFFHSTWMTVLDDHHYLEVTLPEGLDLTAFSFSMTARGTSHPHQFPAVLEIKYVSDLVTELQNAVVDARALKPYAGTAVGFYNADVNPFLEALASAEALLETELTDAAAQEAMTRLADEKAKLEAVGVTMPDPNKKYRIISAGPFFAAQGVHKALTVHSDSAKANWIWWETASPDSAQQVFSFEYIENEDNLPYYAIKHEQTGLYIGELFQETDGELAVVANSAGVNVEKDTVELVSLGLGQFGLVNEGMFHTGDHNSGTVGTGGTVYGCAEHGIKGDKSGICKWTATANSGSAWYIREVQELPFAAKNISDLNFKSESISLYEGVNTLTLTADKDCAFADLVVYGTLGEVIGSSVSANGKVATVVLDTTVVETFSFTFANAEGVATVTVDGVISKLSELQEAYDAAIAQNPVKGDALGQYSDLTEYEAAIKTAEAILVGGGTDEEIEKAVADLDSAVVHLVDQQNLPAADKEYFIISAMDAFMTNHGTNMAIYAKEDAPAWTYANISDPAYRWKFNETDKVNKKRSFYVQNVATQMFLGCSEYLSEALVMTNSQTETRPFQIDWFEDYVVTIRDSKWGNANLHFNSHSSGAGVSGTIVYWETTVGTASAIRIVEAEQYIQDYLNLVSVEDIEIADEYVAPAKKGIYDLYGRRIETPAATGIYIVDGKKRVVKK